MEYLLQTASESGDLRKAYQMLVNA